MAGAQHTKEYKAVVTALVKLRSERGLSQTDLAQLLGRHRSYVAKVEICERRLDIVEFCKWVNALSFDPAEFIRIHLLGLLSKGTDGSHGPGRPVT
ncbi:MAG: helix-turn-helix domain-containing protein [Sulfitobacter sp.]|jgi:transcriptional regulator with XRE-family HTH domain|uniref:helix-turn-helix domain-containing protein n=1 Tax=Sulfitobacter TaxID=60136 RepID=UPI0026BD96BC|tara:strand:- start:939 stop:1226 length:288 start_codon:yes stop_codon:yes gene_type:complete